MILACQDMIFTLIGNFFSPLLWWARVLILQQASLKLPVSGYPLSNIRRCFYFNQEQRATHYLRLRLRWKCVNNITYEVWYIEQSIPRTVLLVVYETLWRQPLYHRSALYSDSSPGSQWWLVLHLWSRKMHLSHLPSTWPHNDSHKLTCWVVSMLQKQRHPCMSKWNSILSAQSL